MARDAAEIARLSADAMWAGDKASQGLGMEVLEVGSGARTAGDDSYRAHAQRPWVVPRRLHFHAGRLAPSPSPATRMASPAVAQHCTMTYVAPGRLGMRLIAEAQERQRGERSGIYDITVRDETGTVIAEFRGHSRTLPGSLIDGAT